MKSSLMTSVRRTSVSKIRPKFGGVAVGVVTIQKGKVICIMHQYVNIPNSKTILASIQLEAFAQFGSDLDAATQMQLNTGARLVELLKQPQFVPIEIGSQIFIMFAGSQNVLNILELATDKINCMDLRILLSW